MDSTWASNIKKLIADLQVEADKSSHEPIKVYELMHQAQRQLSLLMMQISYLESKIEQLTESKDDKS